MTYTEFQRQLGKAGLTVRQFSNLVRMNHVSISNYKKQARVPTHLAIIAVLMAEMAENHVDFEAPVSSISAESKKPRGRSIGARANTKTAV